MKIVLMESIFVMGKVLQSFDWNHFSELICSFLYFPKRLFHQFAEFSTNHEYDFCEAIWSFIINFVELDQLDQFTLIQNKAKLEGSKYTIRIFEFM